MQLPKKFNILKESSTPSSSEEPWYQTGLHFECTGCGDCCTGAPGYVWISDEEIIETSKSLGLSMEKFIQRYIRRIDNRLALTEHSVSYDCVFLKDKKCMIYKTRPTQCRTFPWWIQNLRSQEDWEQAAMTCEGINSQAPIVPFSIIQEQLNIQQSISLPLPEGS